VVEEKASENLEITRAFVSRNLIVLNEIFPSTFLLLHGSTKIRRKKIGRQKIGRMKLIAWKLVANENWS